MKKAPDEKNCKDCYHALELYIKKKDGTFEDFRFECRRFPPSVIGVSNGPRIIDELYVFPKMHAYDFCSEFTDTRMGKVY